MGTTDWADRAFESSEVENRRTIFSDGDNWWLTLVPELEEFLAEWDEKIKAEGGYTEENTARIANEFLQSLSGNEWWESTTAEWREWERVRLTDPGTWTEAKRVAEGDANRMALQLGYNLSDLKGRTDRFIDPEGMPVSEGRYDDDYNELIDTIVYKGLDPAGVEREIFRYLYDPQHPEVSKVGSVRTEFDKLRDFANDWLVDIGDNKLWEWAHKIKGEERSIDQLYQSLVDRAKYQHDFVDSDLIDNLAASGLTLTDHLAPVKSAVADVWELNPNELSLTDDWFKDSLVTTGDDGERYINSREAKALAYQDPRYRETDSYRGKMNAFTGAMAGFFGARSWQ